MNCAIILAGGSSRRFASDKPKQFFELLPEQDVLSFAMETFLFHPKIHQVILVTHADYQMELRRRFRCTVVAGGATRQLSLSKGIAACPENCENVLVHDAARPFVSKQILDANLEALKEHDMALTSIPVVDSILQNSGSYLNRDELRIAQTPQSFRFKLFETVDFKQNQYSDDVQLVKAHQPKASLAFVDGSRENFKITTGEDLQFARFVLQKRYL